MLTNYASKYVLDALLGKSYSLTLASNCYLALSTTTPAADGTNFTEPAASKGYARILIGSASSLVTQKMFEQADGSFANHDPEAPAASEAIMFPPALESWGTITYFGIYDAATNGHLLAYGELTTPTAVGADYVALFHDNALSFAIN